MAMRAIREARMGLAKRRGDEGMTLVELLVAIMLLAVVSALVSSAVVQAQRLFVRNDDEGRGLADAKVVLERLGRDVRESRGVLCDGGLADDSDPTSADPLCSAHLQLWIDDNSDYLQQQSEVVTWRLLKSPDGTHYDVLRIQGSGLGGNVPTTQTLATSLIVRTLFTYDTAVPQSAKLVNVSMKYDAIVGAGSDIREAVFSARLRNKG